MKADRKELALNWSSAFVFPGDFSPSGRREKAEKVENESRVAGVPATVVPCTFISDETFKSRGCVAVQDATHHLFL